MRATIIAVALAASVGLSAQAAEAPAPAPQDWSFGGIFGTFDRTSLQNGYQVYAQVCSACHSMKRLYYRNLTEIGFPIAKVKEIAAEKDVTDGPDDEGEMFERPGKPSDHFVSPFPNANAARAANNGALPPDLTLMTKARDGGADYVYALLTGFVDEPPAGTELMDGMYYNPYFPGHQIAMSPPLSEGVVEYADGTEPTVGEMARDIVTFLSWAAEPEMEARKRMGIKVMLFLLVFTGLLYAVKRKVWSKIH